MPIYEYRCENGHTFEVMQRMTDDSLTECTTCGAPVQRVFHPVAVHFKGSGFYTTDYGKKKGQGCEGRRLVGVDVLGVLELVGFENEGLLGQEDAGEVLGLDRAPHIGLVEGSTSVFRLP